MRGRDLVCMVILHDVVEAELERARERIMREMTRRLELLDRFAQAVAEEQQAEKAERERYVFTPVPIGRPAGRGRVSSPRPAGG